MSENINGFLNRIDPDENYFDELFPSINESGHSKYFTISEFSSLCSNSQNSITILNYNIRSFNCNSNSFFASFDFSTLPKIFVLTETWFNAGNVQDIPGYMCYHTFRGGGSRSGGVSVFVSVDLLSSRICDLCFSNITIETIAVEVSMGGSNWCLLGVYRPHSDTPLNFTQSMENILSSDKLQNKKCIVMGDLNIDLLLENSVVDGFMATMRSSHYVPVITKPTRFSSDDRHVPSLLDHIWLNYPLTYESGIILNDITDHTPTFIRFNIGDPSVNQHIEDKVKVTFRADTEDNRDHFLRAVADFRWESLASSNVNDYMEQFLDKLNTIYCESFPLKTKLIPKKRLDNPWLTNNIIELIKIKSRYFKLFKMGIVSKQENNRFKNRVKSIIDKSKLLYYRNLFNANRNNIIKTWSIIRSIISMNPKSKQNIKKIVYNNIEYINNLEIADIFNEFYSRIALDLDNEIPNVNSTDPLSYFTQNSIPTLYLWPVSFNECNTVICQLKNVKQNKNSISVQLIKLISCYIAPVICDLINLSFSTGVFPDVLKCAVVTPVFKSGDPCSLQNYRPISNLPIFSKVFERCIHNRLYKFVTKFSIISPCQFGFMKGLSTESAVLSLIEYLYDALNNKEIAINVFVDFRKAFDTINHVLLFKKLELYGIRGLPLDLLRSYFSNRSQRVRIGTSLSSTASLGIGLPQGSILGPILFLLFINDLPNFSNIINTVLYADDTTLSIRGKSDLNLINNCNDQLKLFHSWSISNRLTINTDKTYYLIVTNLKLNHDLPGLTIGLDQIQSKSSEKFLGVVVDEGLKFDSHLSMLCGKVSRSVGVLSRLRPYLPLNTMISLYYTFIYPYLIYCNLIWGNTFETHLKPLQILQKKALRYINNAPYNSHTNELFYNNRILKLKDINTYFQSIFMFKSDRDSFLPTHSYNTRNRSNLNPNFQRLTTTQRSLSYSAPMVWNGLPEELKTCPSLPIFKRNLKSYLINKYANDESVQ